MLFLKFESIQFKNQSHTSTTNHYNQSLQPTANFIKNVCRRLPAPIFIHFHSIFILQKTYNMWWLAIFYLTTINSILYIYNLFCGFEKVLSLSVFNLVAFKYGNTVCVGGVFLMHSIYIYIYYICIRRGGFLLASEREVDEIFRL